jgi:sugar lactone lactonase YvrE
MKAERQELSRRLEPRACSKRRHAPTRPDSMRADANGNLYVAIYGQGAFWASTGTEFPSARLSCRAGIKGTICNPPAWPSGLERMIFTS